ncbi:MAG: DUF4881 domain-containing protein [Thermodesulfovibrio sp.]|nr:DUF4881 domain-containing protein [Thermodesulfovibrio sp.]
MFNKIMWVAIAIAAIGAVIYIAVGAPKDYGKIDQGRAIAFDKEKRTVTIIRDRNEDPKKPDYTVLPPHTYALPVEIGGEPRMGPEPKVGLRMKLDAKKSEIIIFDTAAQNFKVIPFKTIEKKENVDKKSPLLLDKDGKPTKFPIVDREKKTITLYSGRQKILETFNIPDEYFALPDYTWDAGDEVRIYYREEGKSLKFMNISKTDIYRK